MRIARFRDGEGRIGYGALDGDQLRILDLEGRELEDWLPQGLAVLQKLGAASRKSVLLADVKLLAPIARPSKFLGLGGNYVSHLREIEALGIDLPATQVWFNKQTSCLAGPFDDVILPRQSRQVDYEGELAVVISRRCRNVPVDRIQEVIAGYMVCNDVSARDVQMASVTMTLGKSFDTHGPVGPYLVTPDELDDPQNLSLRTWVNGELRQDASTAEMTHSIAAQICHLSAVFTLEPGDILATGTPAGIAATMRPPRFLNTGDIVRVEIDGLGAIENRFVEDSGDIHIALSPSVRQLLR